MAETPCISSIQMNIDGQQTIYNIKDATARALLEALFSEELILEGGTAPIDDEINDENDFVIN